MHSSSLFGLFTAGLASFAPLASAWTQPKGDTTSGNPLYTPSLNEQVPAGKPYTITWTPTTKGTVTLLLLKGPGSNAVPQYPLVEKYANTGKFVWTPPTTLEPGKTGYGIELIDDVTGAYQFTTQFGITNPSYEAGSPSSSSSSGIAGAYPSGSSSSSGSPSSSAISSTVASASSSANSTSAETTTLIKSHATAPSASASASGASTAVIQPTKPMTVPASLVTAASTAPMPTVTAVRNGSATAGPNGTNGAGSLAASFGGLFVAAAVAVLAL